MSIALLPAFGVHLVYEIAQMKQRLIVLFAYGLALNWVIIFASSNIVFRYNECPANYAIFHLTPGFGGAFLLYYYALLLLAIAMAIDKLRSVAAFRAHAIKGLLLGYSVFLVPTAIVNSVRPSTLKGLPSIMCGFAVLFALILVLYIVPTYSKGVHELTEDKHK